MKNVTTVIRRIQVTEKGTGLGELRNQYLFEVAPAANKLEIKQAVEKMFGVNVSAVNTMRYKGKRKRERMARYGKRADWKRAVVTLREGSKIEMA